MRRVAKVPGTVASIRRFVDSTAIDGVRAPNDSTVVFHLVSASSDFLNLLALPQSSPVPDEYLNYLPDSPEFRQHTLAMGPYRRSVRAESANGVRTKSGVG